MKTAFSTATFAALAMLSVVGCDDKSKSGAPTTSSSAGAPSASGTDAPIELKLLVTADEDGHIVSEAGKGGAAELAGQWMKDEKHCVGAACEGSDTLAMSTGDHFSGAAISSFYEGASTAAVMNAMGYRATALGNHDLDFGEDVFAKLVATTGAQVVAANVAPRAGGTLAKTLVPTTVLTRKGVKIAVVGLASIDTAKTTMADRFVGTTFSPYEAALAEAVPKAWKDGADAVVVLAHECPDVFEPMFSKHADWHVSLVAGAHCETDVSKTAGTTQLASCGRHFEQYLRAKLTIDKSKPMGERVKAVSAERVAVKGTSLDPAVKSIVDTWKSKHDADLAQAIGFSGKALAKDSTELQHVILGSLRKQLSADIALANKAAFRGAIPAGVVTKASIYGAIPYENSVLIASIAGDALAKELARETAVFDGASGSMKNGFQVGGKPIDPKKKYKVATLDFLYFGGDGFELEKLDPSPIETGMVWETPVIDFLKKNPTTAAMPLEALAKK